MFIAALLAILSPLRIPLSYSPWSDWGDEEVVFAVGKSARSDAVFGDSLLNEMKKIRR